MACSFKLLIVVLQLLELYVVIGIAQELKQKDLKAGPQKCDGQQFTVFCYNVKEEVPYLRFLSSVQVHVEPKDKDDPATVFIGSNSSDVKAQYDNAGLFHNIRTLTPWGNTDIRLSAIHNSCIGVEKAESLTVKERNVDILYLGVFICGLVLYLSAYQLSRSVFFHYSTGVTIGVLASLLVLLYIISRFIPKKIGAGAFLCGGWALVLYLFKWIAENFITSEYRDYILIYFIVTGVLSFAVCYWYGPVSNVRTMHLIQGLLQLVGVLCIYSSCQYRPVAVAIIAGLLISSFFPNKYLPKIKLPFRWRRYPKQRLLSMEEYDEQGREETRKALEELRKFCRSPNVDPWKMVSRMDSPKRFAEFIVGDSSHISQDELSLYESDMSLPPEDLITSDSDSEF